MTWVYLVYECDGWGHDFLKRVASSYGRACEWCRTNGGNDADARRVAGYPHDPNNPTGPTEQLVATVGKGGKFFRIVWMPVDGDRPE